jgi:CHAT domain-containing protein
VQHAASKSYWLNKESVRIFEQAIYYALLAADEEKDNKYKEEAFLISERSKSILLFESLQENTANKFSGVPDSLIERESSLKKLASFIEKKKRDAIIEKEEKKVVGYEKELLQIQLEIDKISVKIKNNYPSYYQLKYPELKINPNDIMSKLGDSTVMIEYFQGKNRSFVFVLRKNSFECHQIIADSTVNNRVLEFQKLVSDLPYAMKQPEEYFEKYKKSASELYNFWLGPYLSPKDKGKRLVIINDGSLSYLPFEALLTTDVKTKNPNYKSLPYLLKDYTINYDYSAELWLRHQQSKKQINGRVYAMAPSYIKKNEKSESSVSAYRTGKEKNLRSGIGELPGAEKEFKMLKNRYKGFYPSKMNASEKTWKENAHEYGILHFAMHGLIDEKEPEFSSLVFTEDGNKEEDNFLYAYEIKQSKLNASMVVLSACETGAGKYQRGEGVLSIGRGFMYAGVPSIVMTLWKLNDQSASELIGNFYANLEAGQQKDKALQEAKIKYLETSNDMAAHPALWACFIQLGDYSPIILAQKSYFNYLIISAVIGSVIVLLLFFYRRKNKKATA